MTPCGTRTALHHGVEVRHLDNQLEIDNLETDNNPHRTMKAPKLLKLGLLALFASTATACADVDSPVSAPIDDTPVLDGSVAEGLDHPNPLFRDLGPTFSVTASTQAANGWLTASADAYYGELTAVRRAQMLNSDKSKTKTIDPAKGGRINIGKAGMKLIIPAGALPGTEPMDITVMAYAGKYHVYELLPHGIQFNVPVRLEFQTTSIQDMGEELNYRLAWLNAQSDELARCEKRVEDGKKIGKKCKTLLTEWDSYQEDLAWYQSAQGEHDFVGIYFNGNVQQDGTLNALEIFNVHETARKLTFETTHFSGYALGM